MGRVCRLAVVAVMVASAALVGCERSEPSADQREAIEEAVTGYLDALAEAYSSLSLEPLEGWASAKEMAQVQDLLEGLLATGDRVEATLLGMEVDALEVFRGVNATVRLVEIWQVVRFDAFSGREKGRNVSSVQHTILQLRKVDDRWLVTARIVTQQETPVPEGGVGGEEPPAGPEALPDPGDA